MVYPKYSKISLEALNAENYLPIIIDALRFTVHFKLWQKRARPQNLPAQRQFFETQNAYSIVWQRRNNEWINTRWRMWDAANEDECKWQNSKNVRANELNQWGVSECFLCVEWDSGMKAGGCMEREGQCEKHEQHWFIVWITEIYMYLQSCYRKKDKIPYKGINALTKSEGADQECCFFFLCEWI